MRTRATTRTTTTTGLKLEAQAEAILHMTTTARHVTAATAATITDLAEWALAEMCILTQVTAIHLSTAVQLAHQTITQALATAHRQIMAHRLATVRHRLTMAAAMAQATTAATAMAALTTETAIAIAGTAPATA